MLWAPISQIFKSDREFEIVLKKGKKNAKQCPDLTMSIYRLIAGFFLKYALLLDTKMGENMRNLTNYTGAVYAEYWLTPHYLAHSWSATLHVSGSAVTV